jgi:hypothetical protein
MTRALATQLLNDLNFFIVMGLIEPYFSEPWVVLKIKLKYQELFFNSFLLGRLARITVVT